MFLVPAFSTLKIGWDDYGYKLHRDINVFLSIKSTLATSL